MDGIFNQKLYEVVRNLYDELVAEFGAQDLQSEEFLSSFPYGFVAYSGNEERRRRIVDVALLPEFREEAQNCIDACYSDSSGGDLEFYISLAVEDFLNYIIPRSVGLPNGSEIFERYYRYFDSSIYGKSCLISIFALIRDLWDHHGGSTVLPTGFRFVWMVMMRCLLNFEKRNRAFASVGDAQWPIAPLSDGGET